MLEIKLGVNIEVTLGVGSKTGSKNLVLAFLKCTDRRVGFPKVHGWIHIGLPKVHGRFRIGPPMVSHAICPH